MTVQLSGRVTATVGAAVAFSESNGRQPSTIWMVAAVKCGGFEIVGKVHARSMSGVNWFSVLVEVRKGTPAALCGVGYQCLPETTRSLGEQEVAAARLYKSVAHRVQEGAPAALQDPAVQGFWVGLVEPARQ